MQRINISNSIYTRFAARYLLLALVPMVLAIFIAVSYSIRYDQDKYSENHSMTDSVCAGIRNNLKSISLTTRSLLSSKELTDFLENDFSVTMDYDTYLSRIQTYVQAIGNSNPQYGIRIYMYNPSIPMSMDVFYHLSDVKKEEPIHDFLTSSDVDRWMCAEDFGSTNNPFLIPTAGRFLYLNKIYNYDKKFLGILALSIPESYMLSYDKAEPTTVTAEGHTRIFNLTEAPLLNRPALTDSTEEMQRGTLLWSGETPDSFPFRIVVVTKSYDYRLILWVVFLLLLLLTFGAAFLGIRNLRRFVGQMHECLNAMDTSIGNNYQTRVPVNGSSEIADISRRFNLLLMQAQKLSRQNVEREISNRESQLVALQHQINPHFIYNTMEVFSSRMKLSGNYEDSDAMIAFANIFRYNIATTNALVPLSQELIQIEDYLCIQRLRSPSPTLQTEIEPEHERVKIPKFTLQPIIENAIRHGALDGTRELRISITTTRHGDNLLIRIADNGNGMTEEEIHTQNLRFLEPASTPVSNGISVGLSNINQRLRLFFGEGHHLTLEGLPHGLAVCLTVPYAPSKQPASAP